MIKIVLKIFPSSLLMSAGCQCTTQRTLYFEILLLDKTKPIFKQHIHVVVNIEISKSTRNHFIETWVTHSPDKGIQHPASILSYTQYITDPYQKDQNHKSSTWIQDWGTWDVDACRALIPYAVTCCTVRCNICRSAHFLRTIPAKEVHKMMMGKATFSCYASRVIISNFTSISFELKPYYIDFAKFVQGSK